MFSGYGKEAQEMKTVLLKMTQGEDITQKETTPAKAN